MHNSASIPGGGVKEAIAPTPIPLKKYRGDSIVSPPRSFSGFLGSSMPGLRLWPGLRPVPAGAAYSALQNPYIWWGGGSSMPPPQEAQLVQLIVLFSLDFRPFGPQRPTSVSLCQLPPYKISPPQNKFRLTPLMQNKSNLSPSKVFWRTKIELNDMKKISS